MYQNPYGDPFASTTKAKRRNGKNKAKISRFIIWIILGSISVFIVLRLFLEVNLVTETEVVEKCTELKSRTNPACRVDVNGDSQKQQQQLCYPTTNYRLSQRKGQEIILKSYYGSKEKTTGGDEFYPTIIFNNNSTETEQVVAVGRVSDLSDGRYAVVFKSLVDLEKFDNFPDTKSRFYNVSLTNSNSNINGNDNDNISGFALKNILQYSCGEGALPPPSKEFKPDHGAVNKEIHMEYPLSWIQMEKPLQQTQPQIDLNNFDRVIALGDSLMEQLFQGSDSENEVAVAPPWTYEKIQAPLFPDTLKYFLDPIREGCKNPNQPNRRRSFLGNDTERLCLHVPPEGACSTNRTLLLLNSGVWDLLEDKTNFATKSKTCCDYDADFNDHVAALRKLLTFIRKRFPNVTIGWKSMTAVHIHAVVNCKIGDDSGCISRLKYMSSSRAETIFHKQKELIDEEFPDVLFIDLYNLTYSRAHQLRYSDGRHYKCESDVYVCRDMWNEAFGNSGWA